ncbi:hypothetical protein [Halobellus marinus]|uniref:hypothetical protein n=1 Tax=Halobellus TaxID=1073986 RepID=UPI0028A9C38D|nr:hypothetical protein [Halobellus sp. DFY28]
MQYRWVLLFLLLVGVGALGSAFVGPDDVGERQEPPREQLLQPADSGTYVWPYTSRSRSVEGRTLALNVVIVGTPREVHSVLTDRSELEWSTADGDQGLNDSRSVSPWRSARGAARYTYVGTDADDGRWVESEYQLATGTYLGSRTHIRAYPGPSDEWTALQTHTEYWDWYRLRHSVTGVTEGARTLEGDLRNEPFIDSVSRVYHGHGGGGSDGWMTVIELTAAARVVSADPVENSLVPTPVGGIESVPVVALAAAPLVARLARRIPPARREAARDAVLPLVLVGIVLGVRSVGIAAEGLFPAANPKLFAGVLYPLLIVAPLGATILLGRGRPATRSALLAAAGLGAGFVLDLGAVGVTVVPVRLVLHRTALVGALGLFTLGVARGDRRTVAAGLLAWVGFLVGSLFGIV